MRQLPLLILLLTTVYSCSKSQETAVAQYSNHVGEIAFDEKLDDSDFKESDTLILFLKPGFKGEKPAIINHFEERYKSEGLGNSNGYVTIRFLVNKEGKAGRFRTAAMNFEYHPEEFDKKLLGQIQELTKELNGWRILEHEGKKYDYYTHLTFKIVNGEIKQILL